MKLNFSVKRTLRRIDEIQKSRWSQDKLLLLLHGENLSERKGGTWRKVLPGRHGARFDAHELRIGVFAKICEGASLV